MNFDWNPFLVGGAQARQDSIAGLDTGFQTSLADMFASAPPEIQAQLRVTSAFRSPEIQQKLWDDALAKYGSESAARKWVAPPGRSKHNHGQAVDLKYMDPAAQKWALANAKNFGLAFPMSHEPWHIEPVGARGGHAPQPAAPGGTGGLSFGSAQPNTPAMPSAMTLADMFAGAEPIAAAPVPVAQPAMMPSQIARPTPEAEMARRQALLADVGSWFG